MVKIRLTRMGSKKRPFYRIIAIDERKPRAQRLAGVHQVPQIGPAVLRAGRTVAVGIGRERVVAEARLTNRQHAFAGEQVAVARIARRNHAVEEVDSGRHAVEQILGSAEAHQIARRSRRQRCTALTKA